jgi:predicted nucleic acid-binding protein
MAKIQALPVLAQLPYQFIVPHEVIEELAAGSALGYQIVEAPWVQVLEVNYLGTDINFGSLGLGETAVIKLACEYGIENVCLDDLQAHRLAKTLGLSVVGLLGLLARAKVLGIIPALMPYIEKLLAANVRYSQDLIRKVIDEFGY